MSVRSARYNLLSLRNPKGLTVIPEERDAWAFLDAAGIRSSRQQRAIIELVRGLKHAQLWSKMKAIYPFVGGTATTHKFNLKDPRDADAAFRLTFNGGWTHASTGALPNGTNAYADTWLNEATSLTINNTHISIYSRSNVDGLRCDMGVLTDSTIESCIFSKYNNVFYPRIQATNNGIANTTNSLGLFISNRTSSSQIRAFQNTDLKTITNNSIARSNYRFYIGSHNFGDGTGNLFSNRELAFSTIGDGLTDADATALYAIVQRFQTTLGRNV